MSTHHTALRLASSAYLSMLPAPILTSSTGVKSTPGITSPEPPATPPSPAPTPGAIVALSPGAQLFAAALAALAQTPATSAASLARGQAALQTPPSDADLARLATKMLGGGAQ